MKFLLPNGNPLDIEMIEQAMEDNSPETSYYLNLQTGEVVFFSDLIDTAEEIEQQLEEIDGSDDYIPIERIPSHEAYQWMEDFIAEIVAPTDAHSAEKLSIALMGKGAFRRFKDVLRSCGNEWVQEWYRWRDDQLHTAMKAWLTDLPVTITEETDEM